MAYQATSGRTADCRARATFYIGRAAAALDHIKPDGVIIVGRNNGPSEIILKSSMCTHKFDEASTRNNSASANHFCSGVPWPSLIIYHSPLGFPPASTLSYFLCAPTFYIRSKPPALQMSRLAILPLQCNLRKSETQTIFLCERMKDNKACITHNIPHCIGLYSSLLTRTGEKFLLMPPSCTDSRAFLPVCWYWA